MGLNSFILNCEKDNKELREDIKYYKNKCKRLEEQLKQRDKTIDKIKTFLESCGIDLTMCEDCDIYDVNGIVIYEILQRYKGDNNE